MNIKKLNGMSFGNRTNNRKDDNMSWWYNFKVFSPIVISVIALSVSIFNALRDSRAERFELDFNLVKWFDAHVREDIPFYLWLTITNNSKLPCSILEILISTEDSNKDIVKGIGRGNKYRMFVNRNSNKEVKETYSLNYPQNINAYSSIGGYFHIYSTDGFFRFEEKNVKVTIKTNRGKFNKIVFLDMGKNIFRVLQNKSSEDEPRITKREDGSEIVYINDGL